MGTPAFYLGIDPGANGALAIVDGDGYPVESHSYQMGRRWCADKLGAWSSALLLGIEHVHAFKKQGVTGVFTFGENFGWWQGVADGNSIPTILVSPMKWRNTILDSAKGRKQTKRVITEDPKEMQRLSYERSKARKQQVIDFVNRRFPKLGLAKKDDGMADAICIALYTRQYHLGLNAS